VANNLYSFTEQLCPCKMDVSLFAVMTAGLTKDVMSPSLKKSAQSMYCDDETGNRRKLFGVRQVLLSELMWAFRRYGNRSV
jgi:hypothetical protein